MAAGDIVGPIAPIIGGGGAIVGALIGAGVTYFLVVKRKVVRFAITKTEDFTLPIRQGHDFLEFSVGERKLANLNRASVSVSNGGNTALQQLKFDVVIPGQHGTFIPQFSSSDEKLLEEIKFEMEAKDDLRLRFSVPYLNRKEAFRVGLFFDGATVDCKLNCRLEDVAVKMSEVDIPRENYRLVLPNYVLAVSVISMLFIVFQFTYFLVESKRGRNLFTLEVSEPLCSNNIAAPGCATIVPSDKAKQ
jgi:hypothetical protein